MNRIFAIVASPADYTLDLIRNVYIPRGVEWCFIHGSSKASAYVGELTKRPILSEINFFLRIGFLWKTLRTYDAFVVNGWTVRENLELFFLNWLFFRKPLGWESDTELSIPRNPIKRLAKCICLNMIFRCTFCYGFSGGEYQHKEVFRHYGMLEERIFLMPMMVDNARYARKESADLGWVVGKRPFRFFTLCRLVAIKQVDKVIDAFRVARLANVELHIVGTGQCLETLRHQSADDPRIKLHGAVFGEDKIRLMHAMDCMVLYSSFEPWGLVVNESLSAGIPCIVSDRVGARHHLIENKGSGIVVDHLNLEALADAMVKSCNDHVWYKTASHMAIEVMSHWDYRLYAANFDRWVREGCIGK